MPRFDADNWNKLKNMASKAIGEKMKKKEGEVNLVKLTKLLCLLKFIKCF